MGQQPNIPLEISDLPRPTAHPASPRRWSPQRPGELGSPDEVPWGGAFGTPGPDAGYALTLVKEREIPLAEGESRREAEAVIAALMEARASRLGRAPVAGDAEVAELILGYRGGGSSDAENRVQRPAGAAHHPSRARAVVASVDADLLTAGVDEVRRRAEAGERMIDA